MSDLVIGVDSSTGNTKVEVVDLETGSLIAHAKSPHPSTNPPVSEQNPTEWWDALRTSLQQVQEFLPRVRGLAVSGQQHGLVVLDGSDQPIRSAKLWNDTTSAPQSDALIDSLGSQWWAAEVGSVPGPAFTITKLAWLAAHEPDALTRTRRVGLPHDFLNLQLTGNWVTDRGDASGTGYWSPTTEVYVDDAVNAAGVNREQLEFPRVATPFESVGSVVNPELLSLGLQPETVVAPGSGDNMGAALGLGLLPGDLVVSLGTSGTAYAVSSQPTNDRTGLVAGFADATGRFLPLVCTLNATKVTEAIRALLNVEHAEFDALALQAPQGSNGVTLVPYFDGERTPNRPSATGSVIGLRSTVQRADIARAAVEGVTCGLLDGVDALTSCGVVTDGRFFLIGGGARSAAFATVFASLSEREITVPHNDETVARGAALQAACVLTGADPGTIAARWSLDAGQSVVAGEHPALSAADVRGRYRDAIAER